MKKTIGFIVMLMLSHVLFGQKRLYDPTIVSQQKRQVFERWGDWRPYPKYFLGIQTNFSYATVWGWMAPARNRRYKNGEDIRPLKVGGIENQRLAEVKLQEEESKKIKVEIDSIYKRNVQDLAHWTPATVDADPLWILYYKRMLTPLKKFPEKPSNYRDWGFKDEETYEHLKKMGELDFLQKKLDLMKENYTIARTLSMPRGKRFLKYHKCLIEWRKFKNLIAESEAESNWFTKWENMFSKKKNIKYEPKTDTEIVVSAINNYEKIQKKYE